MQLSDKVTGPALSALGALTLFGAWQQPNVPGQDIGPGVFPAVIGCGLLGCGLLIGLGIGSSFETPEEIIEPEKAPPLPSHAGLRAFLPPLLLLFYILAADSLGFVPTAFAMVVAVAFALGASARLAIFTAILAPLALHAIFTRLLRVPLPDGLLPMPW